MKQLRLPLVINNFFYKLREKGYYIKQGKDITVRPIGKERGIKIARHFGEAYTYQSYLSKNIKPIHCLTQRKTPKYEKICPCTKTAWHFVKTKENRWSERSLSLLLF